MCKLKHVVLLIILFNFVHTTSSVKSDDCFAYNFEQDVDIMIRRCTAWHPWTLGNYSTLTIDGPSVNSKLYMKATRQIARWSCMRSNFILPMRHRGIIEVRVYMESLHPTESVEVDITIEGQRPTRHQLRESTYNRKGWYNLIVEIQEPGEFNAYITFWAGIAGEGTFFLIDYFRYIPPDYKEDKCVVYKGSDLLTAPVWVMSRLGFGINTSESLQTGSAESEFVDEYSHMESEEIYVPSESEEIDHGIDPPSESENGEDLQSDELAPPSESWEGTSIHPSLESEEIDLTPVKSEEMEQPSKESEETATTLKEPEVTEPPPIREPMEETISWILITIVLIASILLLTIVCCAGFFCYKLSTRKKAPNKPGTLTIINNTGRQHFTGTGPNIIPLHDSNSITNHRT